MNFPDYLHSLSEAERDTFAVRAGTTPGYIRVHLMAPATRRKVPRPDLMRRLADATNGAVSHSEMLAYFYGEVAA